MAGTSNTLSNQYLSVMSKTEACKADFNAIVRNCQPEPDEKTKKNDAASGKPHKKSGLTSAVSKSMKSLDDKGKELAGYSRDKVSGLRENRPFNSNAWIDDHCTGLWVTPMKATDKTPADLKKFMDEMPQQLDKSMKDLGDTLSSYKNQFGSMKELFGEMSDVAVDMGIGNVAADIGTKFAAKTSAKVLVGVVGVESVIIPILMTLWTIADAANCISELAGFMGDKGKSFLGALDSIKNVDEKLETLAKELKDEPMKGYTNAMKYAAELNPCTRARKCLLVPYKNTTSNGEDDPDRLSKKTGKPLKKRKNKSQAQHGQGCCPGQTGHHILPNAMFTKTNCPGYSYEDAPTMCLEGTSNSEGWGSHGDAHANLKKSVHRYRESRLAQKKNPNVISYNEASNQGVDAVRDAAASQCDPDCLKAQLNDHYKQCGGSNEEDLKSETEELLPTAGDAKFREIKTPTDNESNI